MFTENTTQPASSLFAMNWREMSVSAPSEQAQPAPQKIQLGNIFDRAVDSVTSAPATPAPSAQSPEIAPLNMSIGDRQALAGSAMLAGDSLREGASGITLQAQGSDMAQLGGQMAKLGMEAGAAAYKLGGEAIQAVSSIFSLGDRNADGIPDSQQNLDELQPVARAPVFQQSMPSPGGMG